MSTSFCPQCGASFQCCPQPEQRCWCLDMARLPAEMLGKDAAACYCPRCLRDKLACHLGPGDTASGSTQ